MAEKNEKILVDITGLSRYHEKLKTDVLSKKQDVISDLEDIRSKAGAAAGAAAQALTDAKAYAEGLVMVDGVAKFDSAGAAAQALTDAKDYADSLSTNYDAAGAAETAEQNAKDYADSLATNYDAAGAAETALDAAKTYSDSLVKDSEGKSLFDTAGAAATAEQNAKDYADGKFQVAGNYETAGSAATAEQNAKDYADGLNTAMNTRVESLEAIDHDQLAADAASSAVATVLDGAPEKFDTLKEVAQWIADSESAASAADLVTRVSALEAINHDAYKDADTALETSLKSYADQSESDALAAAKTYADGLVMVDGVDKFDAAGAAAQALADAKADAASLYQVKIDDLETIRSGAAAGATALQANDFGFATDGDIDALFEIQ